MFRPEPLDIVLIVIAALLLFGSKRLPETARAIASSIREFKSALAGKSDKAEEEPADKDSAKN